MPAKRFHFKFRVIITRGNFCVFNLKTTCDFSANITENKMVMHIPV